MTPDEARAVLGVTPDSSAAEVRAAYRERILAQHPDRNAGSASATAAASALNEALRVLRALDRQPATAQAPKPATLHPDPEAQPAEAAVAILRPDGDSIAVAAPAEDVLLWLHGALSAIGQITYVDVDSGLLEAQVTEHSGNITSVVVSLQGRADGTTEAFCSAERLVGSAQVDLHAIVDRIVARLVDA